MITPLVEARDPARYGGKAAQLAASLASSLPVPPGVALDVDAVEAIVAGHALGRLELFEQFRAVAVRSSAVGEDGTRASFAGQHATVLGARTIDDVVAAIHAVHASAHSASARAYRARMSIGGVPRIAVVIQAMIDADCAGVMFTRHPVTGAEELFIEGAWGLGEAVVSGLVDPDRARLDPSRRLIESSVGDKPVAIRLTDAGTAEVPVENALRDRSCLDRSTLDALCDLVAQCDRVWTTPHDIEWAIASGHTWLLQRRPITARR